MNNRSWQTEIEKWGEENYQMIIIKANFLELKETCLQMVMVHQELSTMNGRILTAKVHIVYSRTPGLKRRPKCTQKDNTGRVGSIGNENDLAGKVV